MNIYMNIYIYICVYIYIYIYIYICSIYISCPDDRNNVLMIVKTISN